MQKAATKRRARCIRATISLVQWMRRRGDPVKVVLANKASRAEVELRLCGSAAIVVKV